MNQPATAPRARVLFVDDEPRILTSMRMLFRNQYTLFFAESGAQALELLKKEAVDVIVSDQRMPGMTGIEMLRAARDLNPNAMRILLTGYSDLNAIIGSINEGEIFRFVNKPWSNDDLSSTVSRAVHAARVSASASALLSDAAAAPASADGVATPTSESMPGLLVMDDDPGVPERLRAILGSQYRVYGASTVDQAVSLLEAQQIGVVISDTRVQEHPVVGIISTLKQHRPELVSVILTERADAGAAIDLVNQGQIYRFITKPISENIVKITVNSALKQHQKLALSPVLHQRYEVEKPAAPPAASVALKFLDRIRSLRSWVSKSAG